jgi:hypothetical protein
LPRFVLTMRTRTFLPRPEYPRPDRQRAFVHGVDWLNLNGAWEFRFDGERRGNDEQWFAPDSTRWTEQILVPFCWESLAAWGEADAAGNDNFYSLRVYRNPLEVTPFNYRSAPRYEVGWYRRTITIPQNEHWDGKRVVLTIGAADFFTDCWCNGRHLGRHEGGFTPFEFDLTDALERSADGQVTATLVLRVEDPMENREQPVGKQWGWYSSASGIWQTVFVEPRAAAHIERFEITTDIVAQEARIVVFTRGGAEVLVETTSPAGDRREHVFPVADGAARGTLPLAPAILWDPNDPQLYRLKLTLRDPGGRDDVVHSYFGMRSLSAERVEDSDAPSALVFNGQPIYLRGALYQSYHAEGIYTAGDVQALRDDILFAKRAGFDMLRVHIKIDDPLLLHAADTLGILLMADFPNFGEGGDTPLGRRRFEEMMRAAVARDFNHPSIIAWCLFNETWGFGGQAEFVKLINPVPPSAGPDAMVRAEGMKLANESAWTWVQAMWQLAKTLDPTRLVEDMSVVAWDHLAYYGHGDTDVNSWHFYTDNYEKARAHIEEVVEKTYAGSTFNFVPGFQQGAQPLINSEYGGVGALDGDVDTSWSFKFLTNELRRHGKLSAYIYTELHDVEWERNGMLNYDRTPKDFGFDTTLVNQGDVLPIDAPPIQRCGPGQELAIEVFSSHFSRAERRDVLLQWSFSGIDSLGWMHRELASGWKPIPFRQHRVELAERIVLRMPVQTMLCTLWVRAVSRDGTQIARNYVQFFADAGHPAREEKGGRCVLRAEPHAWRDAHWSDGFSSRAQAQTAGVCYGGGHGYFEWDFPIAEEELRRFSRIRVLCEASAHREGTPQTDPFAHPTVFRIELNGARIYQQVLPNHPHDARGALSYLRGARGAHGYLASATVEGALLAEVLAHSENGTLRLRCAVPEDVTARGGCTLYGGDCGRYPLPLTVILE